jgi:hypothetical protein
MAKTHPITAHFSLPFHHRSGPSAGLGDPMRPPVTAARNSNNSTEPSQMENTAMPYSTPHGTRFTSFETPVPHFSWYSELRGPPWKPNASRTPAVSSFPAKLDTSQPQTAFSSGWLTFTTTWKRKICNQRHRCQSAEITCDGLLRDSALIARALEQSIALLGAGQSQAVALLQCRVPYFFPSTQMPGWNESTRCSPATISTMWMSEY